MKPGRPQDRYTTFLCWLLASTADGNNDFLPQHKQEGGAYRAVGELLHLSPEAVESHVRKARRLRATDGGMREYAGWLSTRDRKFWLHRTGGVETHLLQGSRGLADYRAWLAAYERSGRSKPLEYRPLPSADPAAIAITARRAASGLRNSVTPRRPRK